MTRGVDWVVKYTRLKNRKQQSDKEFRVGNFFESSDLKDIGKTVRSQAERTGGGWNWFKVTCKGEISYKLYKKFRF
jgi:hypothetical protein